MEALPIAVLERLREFSTPTVANAIEVFNVRPRHEGFMRPEVRCIFPGLGTMVGYAVTLKIRAASAGPPGAVLHPSVHWQKVLEVPAPRVVVVEDLDDPPGLGRFGERSMGICTGRWVASGVVTNGGVRDLEEVEALRFHFFAPHIAVSHAYVHIVEAGTPVRVGGLTVRPGRSAAWRPPWRDEHSLGIGRQDSRGRGDRGQNGTRAHRLLAIARFYGRRIDGLVEASARMNAALRQN